MAENMRGSVISDKNREIEFGEDTKIPCPSCGAQSKQTLRVRSDIDNSQELECPNCEYTLNRKSPSRR